MSPASRCPTAAMRTTRAATTADTDHHPAHDDDGDGQDEPDEEKVEEELRRELERLRDETAMALRKSWAEVEQLQSEGAEGKEKVSQLERELDALRVQQQQQEPAHHRSLHRGHHGDWPSSSSSDSSLVAHSRSRSAVCTSSPWSINRLTRFVVALRRVWSLGMIHA